MCSYTYMHAVYSHRHKTTKKQNVMMCANINRNEKGTKQFHRKGAKEKEKRKKGKKRLEHLRAVWCLVRLIVVGVARMAVVDRFFHSLIYMKRDLMFRLFSHFNKSSSLCVRCFLFFFPLLLGSFFNRLYFVCAYVVHRFTHTSNQMTRISKRWRIPSSLAQNYNTTLYNQPPVLHSS